MEACDLTKVNANCDPFVEVTVKYTVNSKQEKQTQRTKVKKKDNCPVFCEEFVFTVITYNIPFIVHEMVT